MKLESVNFRVDDIAARRAEYIATGDPDSIPLCVSLGESKVPYMNISLAPAVDCPDCSACLCDCYDICHSCRFASTRDARARNSAIYALDPDGFFSRLWSEISRRRPVAFRWFQSGDAPDLRFIDGIADTGRRFPDVQFWGYTKNDAGFNAWERDHGERKFSDIVPNTSFSRSRFPGREPVNPYGDPVFTAIPRGSRPSRVGMHCLGNCGECVRLGIGCAAGRDAYTEIH